MLIALHIWPQQLLSTSYLAAPNKFRSCSTLSTSLLDISITLPSGIAAWINTGYYTLFAWLWGLAARVTLAVLSSQSIKKLTRGWDLRTGILLTLRHARSWVRALTWSCYKLQYVVLRWGGGRRWTSVGCCPGFEPRVARSHSLKSVASGWQRRLQASVTGGWECGPCCVFKLYPAIHITTKEHHGKPQSA
jgi:hypothetical protein